MVNIEFLKDNMYVWRVKFDIQKYDLKKDLKEDFAALARRTGQDPKRINLEYEVIFPENYPHDPPFIRVVQPRFAFHTGHVTIGGSICMESLTPSGWSSARSVESYFVEIISLLDEGKARLDLTHIMPYSLNEAQEAFNRVAR
jgi:ubiquitin-conjugating enzyme E2 Q